MLNIHPISAFHDNYIWTIVHPGNRRSIVIDPGDAAPVIQYLQNQQLQLVAILITHHHWDHTNGIGDLLNHFGKVPVYGPHSSEIPYCNRPLQQDDQIHIEDININFKIIEIPGHTLDHIAYIGMKGIFCGDTLFAGGCGRLFEGNAEQMTTSLEKICSLPLHTQIYCAHEYTLKNLQFAIQVEPDNLNLQKRLDATAIIVKQGNPTLPSNLKLELETNPFLRYKLESVRNNVSQYCGKALTDPISVFTELRKWKDHFS